jgi:hypothetical protein
MPIATTLPRSARLTCLVTAALCIGAENVRGQSMLPFAPGERLEYTGRVHVGVSGRGTLRVEGPNELRGTTTWTLHSDMEGRLGFLRASDQNVSWIDPARMTALRYTTRERHVFSKHDGVVDIFTDEKRWSAQGGLEGQLTSDAPLDELSFLYYLRTLPLTTDTTLSLSRHFDAARNPTTVRVVGREEVEVGAGRFRAVIVEMRVRDARRYRGDGVIRVYLSDDECRLILRLESDVPDAGKATLALSAYSGARCACASQVK